MKQLITAVALCLACSGAAFAQKDAPSAQKDAPTAQNNKMTMCNKDAGDMKGDERKAFMKTCLSAKKVSQQDKMKACNADPKAKATKGDERKAFMKECLSS